MSMTRSILAAIVVAVLIGDAAPSQSTLRRLSDARMPLPETLTGEGVDMMKITRARGFWSKTALKIGDAEVRDFRSGVMRGTGRPALITIEGKDYGRVSAEGSAAYSFRLTDAAGSWRCACKIRSAKSGYTWAGFTDEEEMDEVVECTLEEEESGALWSLRFATTVRSEEQPRERSFSGALTDGTQRYDLKSDWTIAGTRLTGIKPTGFLFTKEGEAVGAIETSWKGALHLRRELAARERHAITAAGAALLLRERLPEADLE